MSPIRITPSASHPSARPHSRSGLRPRSAALLLPLVIGLQGCSALTHYNAVRDLDGAPGTRSEAILMDAKQRGVYTITRTEKGGAGEVLKSFQSFCAEPSPDALSNLAAQFGASVSIAAKGDGSISGGFSEGAANIGLRTQSIQLLRDITYRQCEAYANGGISKLGLETLQRRFQSTMVALLSIEQLTGAVRAPAVVLSSKASGGDPELIAELTDKTIAARSAVTGAEAEVADTTKAATDKAAAAKKLQDDFNTEKANIDTFRAKPTATDSEKKLVADFDASKGGKENAIADANAESKKAETDKATATKNLAARKETLAFMTAARDASIASGGQTSSSGEIKPIVVPHALDAESVKAVSAAVTDIVRDTLSLGYGREVCTSIIGDQTDLVRAEQRALTKTRFVKSSTANGTNGESTNESTIDPTTLAKELEKTETAGDLVLNTCLGLISADATYYSKLNSYLDAKTTLIGAVGDAIKKCAESGGCAKSTDTVRELVKALQIASESRPGPSPVLLTQ